VCVPGKDKKGVGGAEKRKNKEKAASKKKRDKGKMDSAACNFITQ
jgi:hypothetical protein